MSKEIICADAVAWMAGTPLRGSVVTSLPDPEEVGLTPDLWRDWFANAAGLAMSLAKPEAPAIFYQTDRKADGQTHSKAGLLLAAAADRGLRLLWHKIVLRRRAGAADIHRPGYTHLMAFSAKGKPGSASPDVMERGEMIYPNAMGLLPARFAVAFAGASDRLILDPFCGRGTIPAVAEALGFDAVGVDIDPAQCEKASRLRLALVR
jgi:hypothetical protein